MTNRTVCLEKSFKRWKLTDLFATKIELKAKGNRKIGSIFGASLSLLIYLVMISYTIYRL